MGKRLDPKYLQISGYIPKEIGLMFKAECALKEIAISTALETMIREWLEKEASPELSQKK
jgi:hypothetical protein